MAGNRPISSAHGILAKHRENKRSPLRHNQRTDSASFGSAFRSLRISTGGNDRHRGIVEDAAFDRLNQPSFFDEAVDQTLGRVAARIEGEQTKETANSKSISCATAPQESWIREEYALKSQG